MALSPAEQNKIMFLLGYGGKTIQAGSVIYNKVLNDRLNQLLPDTEDLVRSWLDDVANIECQIKAAPARLAAAQVADIRLNLEELQMLRSERKRLAKQISEHLDIPMNRGGNGNISICV